MSLRKGLALLMVAAFSFGSLLPASAVVTVSGTTTNTSFEAYVLPASSTNGALAVQNVNATSTSTLAAKAYAGLTLSKVGNGSLASTKATLSGFLTAQGQALVTTLQPGFAGSNQTQNWNIVVCEKAASAFTNSSAFFFALPSGWNLNLENGTASTPTISRIVSVASSNGVTAYASEVQEKSSTARAGVSVKVSGTPSTSADNRDCFAINLQHENVIAPAASGASTTANLYTWDNGSGAAANTTDGLIASSTGSTDLTFVPSVLDSAATVSLANGDDIISTFTRTSPAAITDGNLVRTQAQLISQNGAIQQTEYGDGVATSRVRGLLVNDLYAPDLVIGEASVGAWNLFDGPSTLSPANTLVNGTTLAANGVTLVCESNGVNALVANGSSTVLVTPLTADVDLLSTANHSITDGVLTIQLRNRGGSTLDPNFVATRLLVQGLKLTAVTSSTSTSTASVQCFAKPYRTVNNSGGTDNGSLVETLASIEATLVNGTTVVAAPIWAAHNGVDLNYGNGLTTGWVNSLASVQADAGSPDIYANEKADTTNGSSFAFETFSANATTIAAASVANGTAGTSSALKTLHSTTEYAVTLATLPTAATVSGDTDKLVTVTIAENSLTPGLPVRLVTSGSSNDGGSDSVVGNADSAGGVTLAVRAKSGQTLSLTAPYIANGSTLSITATARTITPAFTSAAITSELDGTDDFVKRGSKALLVFTIDSTHTVGFSFADVVEDAKVNGAEVVRFGTTNKYATLVRPGAGAFTLAVTVDGTALTKAITLTTAFDSISTTSLGAKAQGKITLADQRTKKGRFVFSSKKVKFLDSVRVYEVDGDGVVSEATVALAAKKLKVVVDDAQDDTDYVCITSERQTDCFDVQ